MMELKVVSPEDYYREVCGLFCTLVEGREQLRPKRAVLGANNTVRAEALDYLCDVEIQARKVLSPTQYTLFQKFALSNEPMLLPLEAQLALGYAWLGCELGMVGPYAGLYWRAKNEAMRESLGENNGNE
jgi:hypothetical protein